MNLRKELEARSPIRITRSLKQYTPGTRQLTKSVEKDQIAALYETGGMPLIKSMLEAANIMMDLDKERRQAMRRMEEIRRRIETVASGDLTAEQCRRDAVEMFDKSNSPEEWGYARMFLATKYGEELASEIIEEVEK